MLNVVSELAKFDIMFVLVQFLCEILFCLDIFCYCVYFNLCGCFFPHFPQRTLF